MCSILLDEYIGMICFIVVVKQWNSTRHDKTASCCEHYELKDKLSLLQKSKFHANDANKKRSYRTCPRVTKRLTRIVTHKKNLIGIVLYVSKWYM